MITVISGTNRKNSKTKFFAAHIYELFKDKTSVPVNFLALDEIPHDWFFPEMYETDQQASSLAKIQDDYILPAEKFVIVSPEYNGGIPGALKLFLDACSIREYRSNFNRKKAVLIGVGTGRAGNLRGMDQLATILNHMGTTVMPNKLPISSIGNVLNEDNEIVLASSLEVIEKQVEEFLIF